MRRALADPNLLGSALAGDSWLAWRTLLIAAMGEELTEDERSAFAKLTGRHCEPGERVEEAAFVVGRRGGKSRAMAVLAVYVALLCEHPELVPGETGVAIVIAPTGKQSRVIFEYALACVEGSPILRQKLARVAGDTIDLSAGTSIEIRSSNFRKLRGMTSICAIADEIAFLMTDEFGSAN